MWGFIRPILSKFPDQATLASTCSLEDGASDRRGSATGTPRRRKVRSVRSDCLQRDDWYAARSSGVPASAAGQIKNLLSLPTIMLAIKRAVYLTLNWGLLAAVPTAMRNQGAGRHPIGLC